MSPRRRSSRKAGWPRNLYESGGYFTWRHPGTKERFGLGRDRASAFEQAIEANLHVSGLTSKTRLVDRLIEGDKPRTLAGWFDRYEEILDARPTPLASNTRASYRSLARRAVKLLGADTKLRMITALQVSDAIDGIAKGGQARTAKGLCSFLRDSFREAEVHGWIEKSPAEKLKAPKVTVRRARLTLEVFMAVYRSPGASEWLRNAMALAIVSAQRREDVAEALFAEVHDGAWWCEQRKTKQRVCLPLELRLDAFGMSLGDVVRQCRTTGVLSKHLVHQTEARGNSPLGRKIWKDTITKRFTEVLETLTFDFEGKEPPTFHEIRSLSARLYKAQKNVNTQELLGHKSADTTLLYEDGRGEWVKVRVGTV